MANTNDMVAGAAAEGYGVLVGWSGSGELTRGRLVQIATSVPGFDAAWLPSAKDPGVQLTRAIHAAQSGMYGAERVAKSSWRADLEPREWSSRWLLVRRADSADTSLGASYGSIALRATLYVTATGHDLDLETAVDGLAAAVRSDFDRRVDAEIYAAADVTAWLADTIRDRLDGVRYGGNWYIPRRTRALVSALCEAFRAVGWGRAWMTPALPIATSSQLAIGLANGLADEAGEIGGEIRAARDKAIAANRADIGDRAAENFVARLRDVGRRMATYANLLGDDGIHACHVAFCDTAIELTSVLPSLDPEAEWSRLHVLETVEIARAA